MTVDWVGYGYAGLVASGGVIGYVKAGLCCTRCEVIVPKIFKKHNCVDVIMALLFVFVCLFDFLLYITASLMGTSRTCPQIWMGP